MIIAEKGYTLSVDSWENDGDFNNTIQTIFQDKETAILSTRILNELISFISNDDDSHEEEIVDYLSKNPEMNKIVFGDDIPDSDDEEYSETASECMRDFAGKFLGWSEYYSYRVPSTITLYYVPQTVEAEEIKI